MNKTETLKIRNRNPEHDKIRHAADTLRRGGLVVFPTETVYGLGANALDPDAVRKVFRIKSRPSDNPLIVHIADVGDLQLLAKRPPKAAKLLMERFWPGPLTIVLRKKRAVPDVVTAGSDTVAVRMPDNAIARQLIRNACVPLAGPSANISGRPSPTKAEYVLDDLSGMVDIILDGGRTRIGIESTVIDMTVKSPVILRHGGVTKKEIERLIGKVRTPDADISSQYLKSPGLKYKHYAPKAEMVIVEGKNEDVRKKMEALANDALKDDKKVGIISFRRNVRYKGCIVAFAGSEPGTIAERIYSVLREMDRKRVDIIISASVSDKGIGLAVYDRIKRAAGHNIVRL